MDAADINPIGSISKTDLKRFIAYARDAFDLPILTRFADLSLQFFMGVPSD
jgi:NAD+ synthase (glutamine-hydrolysing)